MAHHEHLGQGSDLHGERSANGPGLLPADIYQSQVDALFSDSQSLLIGGIAATIAALVAGLETGLKTIVVIAVALFILAWVRIHAITIYNRRKAQFAGLAEYRRWDVFYVIGAALHVSLLGGFCLAAFALSEDAFARLTSISITMAYLVGIPGRSFASDLLVNTLIVCAAVFMVAALAFAGGSYWLIAVVVLLPFFLAMKTISARLRGIFLEAVLRARDVTLLASRFDTALNNMPHGLALLDETGRIVVANNRLAELLRLPTGRGCKDLTIEEVLNVAAESGLIKVDDVASVVTEFQSRTLRQGSEEFGLQTIAGRSLTFTLEPMASGGGVVLVEDVTERRAAQARITHLARFDPLTGLPNRVAFRELVESHMRTDRTGPRSAVMFVDLDQFKQINDTLGHAIGDKLLRAVADRLRGLADAQSAIARFGGDEFVLLHRSARSRDEAARYAATLIAELSHPYEIDSHNIAVAASVGIVLTAERGHDVEMLLRQADMALYRAKAEGRSTWRFFEDQMEIQARARRNIEFDLRNAVKNNELDVYFQPIYSLRERKICTYEALVRWKHAVRGSVPPSDFVPIAEEMGLIVEMGDWVLRQACTACASWPGDVHVAVNFSPVQFRNGHILSSVEKALAASGLAPHRLEIEITESVLLQNLQKTRAVLHQLRDLGVGISLDDFGTGYSSLSYLHSLPLNKIKIDRSFLQGLENGSRALTLLRGITRISVELGLAVVMEGVETESQLMLISTEADVDQIQGYLFGRPAPASEIPSIAPTLSAA